MSSEVDTPIYHTCKICGETDQCKDQTYPGTCDFRELDKAHGYCMGALNVRERIKFFGDGIQIVSEAECTGHGNGFAVNTFCEACVEANS